MCFDVVRRKVPNSLPGVLERLRVAARVRRQHPLRVVVVRAHPLAAGARVQRRRACRVARTGVTRTDAEWVPPAGCRQSGFAS
jgi:hypothetical protein